VGSLIEIVSARSSVYGTGKSVIADAVGRGGKLSTHEGYQAPGSYSIPISKDNALNITVGENRIVIAVNDYSFSLTLSPGDTVNYSRTPAGTIQAYTWYKTSGEILHKNNTGSLKLDTTGNHVFNDGTVSAASFDKLKEGFDQLKADFNAHTHTGNLGNPTSAPLTASTATIDPCEVTEVKLP